MSRRREGARAKLHSPLKPTDDVAVSDRPDRLCHKCIVIEPPQRTPIIPGSRLDPDIVEDALLLDAPVCTRVQPNAACNDEVVCVASLARAFGNTTDVVG